MDLPASNCRFDLRDFVLSFLVWCYIPHAVRYRCLTDCLRVSDLDSAQASLPTMAIPGPAALVTTVRPHPLTMVVVRSLYARLVDYTREATVETPCHQVAASRLLSVHAPTLLVVIAWHVLGGVVDLVVGGGRACTLWPAMEAHPLGDL